ncbi:MAG: ECF transporter S component [Oscillospiraceae bacterium]|nr:ECF transporter S component [Oscillospiraceae bacterium]
MPKKARNAIHRLAINSALVAIYVVLRFFNLSFGDAFRFTLAAFSVVLCALLYGPVDGMVVGFVGEFMAQILGPYGLTPTTLLWCLGETLRGGVLGGLTVLFIKNWLFHPKTADRHMVIILLASCIAAGIMASLGQTLALYVDSKMVGYYNYDLVFGAMIWRMVTYVVLSIVFGYLSLPIITALRKSKLV